MGGMAQRPPYLMPDFCAVRLQTMDDRRRDHRADADTRDHSGGLSHHTHDCTHQRPISGGSQPPESEGQHTRQQKGRATRHEQYHPGGGIGQQADLMTVGAHGYQPLAAPMTLISSAVMDS